MMQNPSYSYPYQQQFNPYLDRLNNLQQYQQMLQPQAPVLTSRIVDNFDIITANDVPMNGQAIFLKSDGTEIQVRTWGKMGNIEIAAYKPLQDALGSKADILSAGGEKPQESPLQSLTDDIKKRFDSLEAKIDELKRPVAQKATPKVKKDGDAE